MSAPIISSAQTIQTILAPAVMISACGLLLLGMQNKYGRLIDRLRLLAQERLALVTKRGDAIADVRLAAIDRQMPELQMRLKTQHDAVLCLFWAVVAFVTDTFIIAASLLLGSAWGNLLALLVFLAGMALVFWAGIQAASEIRISTRAVTYDVEESMKL